MARPEESKIQQSAQISFEGGTNTALPPDRIAENQAVDIVNFRFDDQSSLLGREGTVARVDRISAATITNRITSVFNHRNQGIVTRNIFTTGSDIRTFAEGSIKGALTLPSNTFWMWKQYGNLSIGTNKGTGANANPVKVAGGVGNAAALAGSPPKAKYIEIWNDRVWLIGALGSDNTLYGSALGNAEDWTTTGVAGRVIINIEPDDGDIITGIIAFRERLFIYKRNRIYTVQAIGGAFPTDASALSVELYAQGIGCVSAYSIQPVLDDVLYLSRNGVASLVASERVGDFTAALLSRNIQAIKNLAIFGGDPDLEIAAVVLPEHNQYWLMVPESFIFFPVGPPAPPLFDRDVTFVLDYRRIQEGLTRWTRYIGTAAAQVGHYNDGGLRLGGKVNGDGTTYVVSDYDVLNSPAIFVDNFNGTDAEVAINKKIVTKTYDFNAPFIRKDLQRYMADLIGQGENVDTVVTDRKSTRLNSSH